MSAMSGGGTPAASSASSLRSLTGSMRSAGGNSGMNASSSGSMPTIVSVGSREFTRHPSRVPAFSRTDRAYPRVYGGTGQAPVAPGSAGRGPAAGGHVLRHADAQAGGPAGTDQGGGGPGRVRGRDPAARHGPRGPHDAGWQARPRATTSRVDDDADHPGRRGDRHGVARTPRPSRPPRRGGTGQPGHRRGGGGGEVRPRPHHHGRPGTGGTGDQRRERRRGEGTRAAAAGFRGGPADPGGGRAVAGAAGPGGRTGVPEPPGEGGHPGRRGRHPGNDPGPVSRGRAGGGRRRGEPRGVVAGGPHGAALHDRTGADRRVRRSGGVGTAGTGARGMPARQ